jgi:LmbE family N-acetylglucosaminyl deacetylase
MSILALAPSVPRTAPLTVLCLGAHSDDLEIGCGGTILQLLAARPRVHVHWVVLSGDARRAREAQRSAERLLHGAARTTITLEGMRDGFFPYIGGTVKEFFEQLKTRVRPDLIFTHHRHDRHQDHRVVAELTWNSFREHFILEYEIPKYDGGLETPNVFVPIDKATCRRKVRHLMSSFASQRNKQWFDAETFLALLRLRGLESASPTGYAEGFHANKAAVRW